MNPMLVAALLMNQRHERPRCPKCEKLENIKEVCKNCGYEYLEEEQGLWSNLFDIFIIVCFFIALGALVFIVIDLFYNMNLWPK